MDDFVWYKVFDSIELAENAIPLYGSILVDVANKQIGIARNKNGFWAFENNCPHQNLPLIGSLCDDIEHIVCSFHFMKINLRTGKCDSPHYNSITTYPVQIRKDGIFIEI